MIWDEDRDLVNWYFFVASYSKMEIILLNYENKARNAGFQISGNYLSLFQLNFINIWEYLLFFNFKFFFWSVDNHSIIR